MTMPLEGIRVIDWTIYQQGPVATSMLGDLGADVIKIEPPQGSTSRRMPPFLDNAPGDNAPGDDAPGPERSPR
ncbi:MAG: CoA transferase, partial [Dehalococcoidia bacterium]|nr:CoA transferase [Dehalococcoidia bacterium]